MASGGPSGSQSLDGLVFQNYGVEQVILHAETRSIRDDLPYTLWSTELHHESSRAGLRLTIEDNRFCSERQTTVLVHLLEHAHSQEPRRVGDIAPRTLPNMSSNATSSDPAEVAAAAAFSGDKGLYLGPFIMG